MAQSSINVPNPQTGTPVDTSQILVDGVLVNRQRMIISDDNNGNGVASVVNVDPTTNEYALVVRNIPSGIQYVNIRGEQSLKSVAISPQNSLKASHEHHLAGSNFFGRILDRNLWTYNGLDSDATVFHGILTLNQILGNNIFNSSHAARYIAYKSNYFKCSMAFDGLLNMGVKKWGAFDLDGGIFFQVDTDVNVVTRQQGGDTVVSSANFNGGNPFILDSQPHIYEIQYSEEVSALYQDGKLIHSMGHFIPPHFKLSLPVGIENSGPNHNSVMIFRSANIFTFENTSIEPEVFNDDSPNAVNVLKYSPGSLQKVIINTSGDTASWLTVYDGFDTTGKKLAKISMSIQPTTLIYDFNFYNGLTIATSADSPGDYTIVYD